MKQKKFILFLTLVLALILTCAVLGCSSPNSGTSQLPAQQPVANTPQIKVTAIDSASDSKHLTEPTAPVAVADPQPKENITPSKVSEPTPQPTSDNLITINIDSNRLTLLKNGVRVEAYEAYPVATGQIIDGVCITPTGQFIILNKQIDPPWTHDENSPTIAGGDPSNPLWRRWLGTSAGKRPGESIGIHGNIDYASIGTHASGGCIRMYNEDIAQLYEVIPIGTSVWIGTTDQLTSWGVKGFE